MNGRPTMDGDAVHRATQEALPWLLNGRLDGAGLDAAQAHLAGCAACRADLQQLRRLQEAAELPDPHCDPDAALGRLFARIDAPGQPPAQISPPLALPRRAANDPRWLRRLALAQCGAIVLLAFLLARPGPPADSFRGLGAAPAAAGQAVVVFRPETAEHELRRILRASGARVVGGPTVTDAWLLAMPPADAAASLARLRAEPAVLLAEPLATGHP